MMYLLDTYLHTSQMQLPVDMASARPQNVLKPWMDRILRCQNNVEFINTAVS